MSRSGQEVRADIRSCPPKVEDVSSIRNLRTRHAVVTKDPPNMVQLTIVNNICFEVLQTCRVGTTLSLLNAGS
jgi:hypothetical protein